VIHSTIVNGLLDADLVLVDLTEHNPNVLFELGLRIAERKPTVLVKAIGTNPIFDVDNLMRVVSYNPNLWPSTVKEDLPRLTEFIKGAWAMKDTDRPYMDILRQQAVVSAP
jgi:nucleoside 2-deoxyribosyltransferase